MTQADKARAFADLHVKGDPVVIYNIWDAGSAQAVEAAGAKAVATGSASVAGAHGFPDGQALPLDRLLWIVERIVASIELPVSIDFEGAYGEAAEVAAHNVDRLVNAGAIGINFEDQVVGTDAIHGLDDQCARIRAIRAQAERREVPLFINARTDLFLKNPDKAKHAGLMGEAKERAAAFAEAGANGFFAPLLSDETLIGDLVAASPLPVNIMAIGDAPPIPRLAELGVARVSFGPGPWRQSMKALREEAGRHF